MCVCGGPVVVVEPLPCVIMEMLPAQSKVGKCLFCYFGGEEK